MAIAFCMTLIDTDYFVCAIEQPFPKLIHYNKVDKGGHFAAWEQPRLFSEEVRNGFRSLRN
jgi:pimeloyl-ACP methyl ester carboxylesterase